VTLSSTRTLRLISCDSVEQVFFRAGVLGQMEEFRDERLSRIMSWMQAWARGYLNRKTFKKLQEQRMALTVVQRSLRRYLKLRTWPWWKLWQKVKPLLNASRVEDQIAVSIATLSARDAPSTFWFNIDAAISLSSAPAPSYSRHWNIRHASCATMTSLSVF
jgi:hypothetical protein